jgi:hypothetical protein
MDLDDNDNDNRYIDNYEDNALGGNDSEDNDKEVPEEADAPQEDKNSHWVPLLDNVVYANQDYGLGLMVTPPDVSADTPVIFEGVEL